MTSLRLLSLAACTLLVACDGDDEKKKPQPPAPSAPVAVTNGDQTIAELSTVTLNGDASYDADDDLTGYQWTQTLGPAVTLTGATTSVASFTAPNVGGTTTFRFQLTVTDAGGRSDSASATITIIDLNAAPQVDAGVAQTVNALSLITLTGAATDPDAGGSVASSVWTQVGGPDAGVITNAGSLNATVMAPDVDQPLTLIFQLAATDNEGKSASDTVEITVQPVATQLAFTLVPATAQRNSRWGSVNLQVRNAAGARIIGGAASRVEIALAVELEGGGAAPGTLGGTLTKTSSNGLATFTDLTYDRLTSDGARLILRATSVNPAGLSEAVSTLVEVTWPSKFPGLVEAGVQIEVHDLTTINDAGGAGLIVVGAFSGTNVNFDLAGTGTAQLTSTNVDGFVARYALNNGDLVWANAVTGAGDERVTSVQVGSAGDVVITASYGGDPISFPTATTPLTEEAHGGNDLAFAELDGDGFALWTGSLVGSLDEEATDIAANAYGGVTVVGAFRGNTVDFDPGAGTALSSSTGGTSNSDAFVLQLSPTGAYEWHYVIGTNAVDRAVAVGHVVIPGDPVVAGVRDGDAFLLRLVRAPSTPGVPQVQFDVSFGAGGGGGDHFDVSAGFFDVTNRMTIAGTFTGTVDLDPGAGTASVSDAAGVQTGFVVTLDGLGAYVGHAVFNATNLTITDVMARTVSNRSVLVSGTFRGDGDFDPATPTPEVVGQAAVNQGFLLALVGNAYSWVDVVDGPAGVDSPITALASNGPLLFAAAEVGEGSVDLDIGPTVVEGTVAAGNAAALLAKLAENGRIIP